MKINRIAILLVPFLFLSACKDKNSKGAISQSEFEGVVGNTIALHFGNRPFSISKFKADNSVLNATYSYPQEYQVSTDDNWECFGYFGDISNFYHIHVDDGSFYCKDYIDPQDAGETYDELVSVFDDLLPNMRSGIQAKDISLRGTVYETKFGESLVSFELSEEEGFRYISWIDVKNEKEDGYSLNLQVDEGGFNFEPVSAFVTTITKPAYEYALSRTMALEYYSFAANYEDGGYDKTSRLTRAGNLFELVEGEEDIKFKYEIEGEQKVWYQYDAVEEQWKPSSESVTGMYFQYYDLFINGLRELSDRLSEFRYVEEHHLWVALDESNTFYDYGDLLTQLTGNYDGVDYQFEIVELLEE